MQKLTLFFLLISTVLVSANTYAEQETAKVECHDFVGPNSIGQLVVYLGTKEALIEKLTFEYYYAKKMTIVADYRMSESSLPSWSYYYYATGRESQPGPGGYYYIVTLDKSLVAKRYVGPLGRSEFRISVSEDAIHSVTLAGECSLSWVK